MTARTKTVLTLFLIGNVLLQFYRAGISELGGDESASYLAIIPFFSYLRQGKILPSFLTYFHEPLQLVFQAPFVLFGINEVIARLPNILSGTAILFVLFKIVQRHFGYASEKFTKLPLFVSLFLISFSSYFILTRQAINIGIFAFLISLFIYHFLNFVQSDSQGSFKMMMVFLFLSVFVYVDSLFLIPGLLFYLFLKKSNLTLPLKRQIIVFILGLAVIFLVWGLAVFFGSITSHVYSWQQSAPFRLFFRGGSGLGHLSLAGNYAIFSRYTSNFATVFMLIFFAISFINRKSKPLWCIFLLPLLYFNLIKNPTVHLLHFFVVVILLASLGWQSIWEKSSVIVRMIMMSIFSLAIVANIYQIADNLKQSHPKHYREVALYIEKETKSCEFILTDVDGYSARLYFRRRYVNSLGPGINLAVVGSSGTPLYKKLINSGYVLTAVTPSTTNPDLFVLQKNRVGSIIELQEIDSSLTSFDHLLPYQNCQTWKLPSLWTIQQH